MQINKWGRKMKELDINIKKSIIESITRYASANKRYDGSLETDLKSGFISGLWMGLISAGYKYNVEFSNVMYDVWDNAKSIYN